MIEKTLRARLKPVAARFGIHSSVDLWERIALRQFSRKLRAQSQYREWVEREAPRWVSEHWGHHGIRIEYARTHLTSQLYELSEMLRRRIGSVGEARVLDAGASDGFFLERLGVRGGVGVNFLRACACKIRSQGYAACVADIEDLPFPDQAFDYVICCETLEHVLNPIRTLKELIRVCRRRMFLTIPWLPRTRVNPRPAGWPQVESHVFEFSERDFAKVLTHARVRLVFRDVVQVFPEPKNPLKQLWLRWLMYPGFFPKLQYYELEPL